jgi:hypothetical protein
MTASSFELRVIHPTYRQAGKRHKGEYGVALYQQPVRSRAHNPRAEVPRLTARVWGAPFRCTVDRTLATLKDNGYRASDLSKTRIAPFVLDEESGVRLGLLFLTAKPLRKPGRIETISGAIWAMGAEEAYYWFSKCTDVTTGRRARRALRILLADR